MCDKDVLAIITAAFGTVLRSNFRVLYAFLARSEHVRRELNNALILTAATPLHLILSILPHLVGVNSH